MTKIARPAPARRVRGTQIRSPHYAPTKDRAITTHIWLRLVIFQEREWLCSFSFAASPTSSALLSPITEALFVSDCRHRPAEHFTVLLAWEEGIRLSSMAAFLRLVSRPLKCKHRHLGQNMRKLSVPQIKDALLRLAKIVAVAGEIVITRKGKPLLRILPGRRRRALRARKHKEMHHSNSASLTDA